MGITCQTVPRVSNDPTTGKLTLREQEVVKLIAEDHTTKEMATRMGVTEKTVLTHRYHLMRKLDLHSVAAVCRYAYASGLVKLLKESI